LFGNLTLESQRCVLLRTVSELSGDAVLRQMSKPTLDVVSRELEFEAAFVNSTQRDMHVRMVRIEVGYGDPFNRSAKVRLHPTHYIPREAFQVHPLTEFGRQN
jgi:hypothetical protein